MLEGDMIMDVLGKESVLVIGHRNPDTDSICSAICYAALKRTITGGDYIACRAGSINPETRFVLDYFHADDPVLVESVKTQVKDIEVKNTPGVPKGTSLMNVWRLMQEYHVTTIPCVNDDGVLEGLITVGDITGSYMNVDDSRIIAKAHTKYQNILDTLSAAMICGDPEAYFTDGKVLVGAASPDLMEKYIEKGDLVILGNRYESQLCAIEAGAGCIVVGEDAQIANSICRLADEHGCAVISTPYDTYAIARLLNQSMPMSYFMTTENIDAFTDDDYLVDIRDIMTNKRHREFPILDNDGRYLGMISRQNLLGANGKKVILVDHNEKAQAVDGIENADILEIIDHHRLGSVETMAPVFFRNQPLGCTATILYQMYLENQAEITPQIAGLLCSAIISDTLLFRSPTCTSADNAAALILAQIAGIDIEDYAMQMFEAGSDLKGKSDEEIFYQDFKRFVSGNCVFGIGQITSLNAMELKKLEPRMMDCAVKAIDQQNMNMMFFMLTNILTESTDLVCAGPGAVEAVSQAFYPGEGPADTETKGVVHLPGVVSRKKQLAPQILMALQQ